MRKPILIVLATSMFIFSNCSNDDESCKTCNNIVNTGQDAVVCDNGDGTATLTLSKDGRVVHSETTEISEGGSIDDFVCDEFDFTFDL